MPMRLETKKSFSLLSCGAKGQLAEQAESGAKVDIFPKDEGREDARGDWM